MAWKQSNSWAHLVPHADSNLLQQYEFVFAYESSKENKIKLKVKLKIVPTYFCSLLYKYNRR